MDEQKEKRRGATHRKLTTVLSADVQGYSRLMEVNEEATLETLKQYRDAMARLITAHDGRVVNTWGDGLIAEFPSVVEAVRAAIDVQTELARHNATRTPDARMLFRIGINLGDVIVEGNDIYGDGVNIAARLQAEAQPGGILISNTVYDQVRNKIAVSFDFLGNLAVKNLDDSVPSYAVRIGDRAEAAKPTAQHHDHRMSETPTADEAGPVFGRGGDMSGRAAEVSPAKGGAVGRWLEGRKAKALLIAAAVPVAINLVTWEGEFWAQWPLFGIAMAGGLIWARQTTRYDRVLATFGVVALGVTAVNLLSWSGEFWAQWPLLGLAIAAGMRWMRRRKG